MVSVMKRYMKQTWYPRVHRDEHSWYHSIYTGAQHTTMYPLMWYDEGLGNPTSYPANPEHSSYAPSAGYNCFPESRINDLFCRAEFTMTKGALVTDNIDAIRAGMMVIKVAFPEVYDTADERTGTTISEILELQKESTDRQGYPLYNGTKMTEKYSNSALLTTGQPGLTTTQVIEGVSFSHDVFYDSIDYYSNSEKVQNAQRGLKWFTLSRDRPIKSFKIKIDSAVKRMNPYTFFALLITVPLVDTQHQIPTSAETSAISHVGVRVSNRFNEWNEFFNMGRG